MSSDRQWSQYQEAIFSFPEAQPGNLIIEAGPGSGKTTTMVELANRLPIQQKTIMMAFGSEIAAVLKTKLPRHVGSSTLNSAGWSVCRNVINRGVVLEKNKVDNILRGMVNPDFDPGRYWKVRATVLRLCGALRSYMKFDTKDYLEVADLCGFEIPPFDAKDRFEMILGGVYNDVINTTSVMDYDDQVFQPIYRDCPLPYYDWVIVDEAQDLSPLQIEFVRRLAYSGRSILVGDEWQAIYGFRGADSDALRNAKQMLSAASLPLPICYRCPDDVIEEAKRINPNIEAPVPNPNGKGIVKTITTDDFLRDVKDGDFVLCRTTAPLISRCLQLIRRGQKAVVKGRDLGNGILDLIEKIHGAPKVLQAEAWNIKERGVYPDQSDKQAFMEKLNAYAREQLPRLEAAGKDDQVIALTDKIDTIDAIGEECDYVAQVCLKIEKIFSDTNSDGVTFMTGHKAKGLEAKRVFLLRRDRCPHPKAKSPRALRSEKNLLFVMITRSQAELYSVLKDRGEK